MNEWLKAFQCQYFCSSFCVYFYMFFTQSKCINCSIVYLFIKLQKLCLESSHCCLGNWERVIYTSHAEALDSSRL